MYLLLTCTHCIMGYKSIRVRQSTHAQLSMRTVNHQTFDGIIIELLKKTKDEHVWPDLSEEKVIAA